MRRRGWIAGGCVLAAAAVVTTVALWPPSTLGADTPLVATLTDMQHEDTGQYVYADWWSDGSTSVRLTADDDGLVLDDPFERREGGLGERLTTALPGSDGTEPAAVAARQSELDRPWVALAFQSSGVALDDTTTTDRPLVWTGPGTDSDDAAPEAVELPVDLRSNESGGAIRGGDAAVARIAESELAVVTTTQLESGSLHVCAVEDCRWRDAGLPGGLPADSIGSTGRGVVAVTDEASDHAVVWYADDADLTWEQVGSAPPGTRLAALQDGVDQAVLVWRDRGGMVVVQTVGDGQLVDAVGPTPVDGGLSGVRTVLQHDGRWYLGGERPSQQRISLAYDAVEPTVWELGERAWTPLVDPLLANQPDQGIVALLVDADDDLRAVSTSAVLRVTMTWRLSREEV